MQLRASPPQILRKGNTMTTVLSTNPSAAASAPGPSGYGKPCCDFNYDLSENVAYNIAAFPAYAKAGLLSLYPGYAASSHWHEDLEFIVILSGAMTYNVNGQLIELTAGNGVFVNSRQLHYGFSGERHECHFICVILHPSLLSSNLWFFQNCVEPFIRNLNCPYLRLDQTTDYGLEIMTLLKEIFAARETDAFPFTVQRHFFRILELLCPQSLPAPVRENRSCSDLDSLKNMMLYIQDHYPDKITLTDIAKSGSCCKSKCTEIFRRYLTDSPVTYVNKFRLKKSCDMLQNTSLSVTEIAAACGYHSSSYYCETFRKYYGNTPQQYRSWKINP